MILKLIRLTARPGCRDELIRRQRTWNDAMARQEGFRFVHVATDPDDPAGVAVVAGFESRDALDRFMRGDHDPVQDATRMRELYERIEVRVLDVVESA